MPKGECIQVLEGEPVDVEECDPTCCELGGEYSETATFKCRQDGGVVITDQEQCTPVCCVIDETTANIMPRGQCTEVEKGKPLAVQKCDPKCCALDGEYFETSEILCEERGGTPLDQEQCTPKCCVKGEAGNIMPKGECIQVLEGEPVDVEECDPTCCELGGEYSETATFKCRQDGGVVITDQEQCTPVCCVIDETTANIMPRGQCTEVFEGESVPPEQCEEICCDGVLMPKVFCAKALTIGKANRGNRSHEAQVTQYLGGCNPTNAPVRKPTPKPTPPPIKKPNCAVVTMVCGFAATMDLLAAALVAAAAVICADATVCTFGALLLPCTEAIIFLGAVLAANTVVTISRCKAASDCWGKPTQHFVEFFAQPNMDQLMGVTAKNLIQEDPHGRNATMVSWILLN